MDSFKIIMLPSKRENLLVVLKINIFLQKPTTYVELQAVQIFSVNI